METIKKCANGDGVKRVVIYGLRHAFKMEDGGLIMKKKIIGIVVLVMFTMASVAFAGGDQNRGDKGKGSVVRTQVTGKGK